MFDTDTFLGYSDAQIIAAAVGAAVLVLVLRYGPLALYRAAVRAVRRRRRPELNPGDPVADLDDRVRYGLRPRPGPAVRLRRAVMGPRRP